MKICEKCNKAYSEEFMFCPKCGGPLIEDCNSRCPDCKKVVEDDYVYCPYCGCDLNKNTDNEVNDTVETNSFEEVNNDITTDSEEELRLGIESENNEDHEEAYNHFGKAISLGNKEALIWYIASPESNLLEDDVLEKIRPNVNAALEYDDEFKFEETFQKMSDIADSLEISGLVKEDEYESTSKNEFYKVAFKLREHAAKHGIVEAMYSMAWAYENGEGVDESYDKAFINFEKAANHGHIESMYYLGNMYLDGKGVAKNLEKAKELFQKAAEQGSAEAEDALDRLKDLGDSNNEQENSTQEAKVKHKEDIQDLINRANSGDTDAASELGNMYYFGRKVEKDHVKAAHWIRMAAEKGIAVDQFNLGVLYENGEGVPKDQNKAREWYEKAADSGEFRAFGALSRLQGDNIVLNEKRYESVKAILSIRAPHLTDDDIKWNSNFVEIVDKLTNHKMSDADILDVNNYLDDVLRGHKPEVAIAVDKNDSGRMLIGLMGGMEPTSHLNIEEKRWFAYSIIIRYYLRIFDKGETHTGIILFTSVAKIKFEYEHEHGSHFFETFDNFPQYDKTQPFGYSIKNPITAITVRDSAIYLKNLKSGDGRVSINRIGAIQGAFGEIIDKYEVTITKKQFFSNEVKKHYLYVNEFGLENSKNPPNGFTF